MIDRVVVWLRAPTPVFSTASLVTQVYPSLKDAESVSPREMQWLLIRSRPYRSAAIAFAATVAIGVLLWRLALPVLCRHAVPDFRDVVVSTQRCIE